MVIPPTIEISEEKFSRLESTALNYGFKIVENPFTENSLTEKVFEIYAPPEGHDTFGLFASSFDRIWIGQAYSDSTKYYILWDPTLSSVYPKINNKLQELIKELASKVILF